MLFAFEEKVQALQGSLDAGTARWQSTISPMRLRGSAGKRILIINTRQITTHHGQKGEIRSLIRKPMTQEKNDLRYEFDASKFPKRLELDLPEDVVAFIERRAAETGRSFSEVVTDLLAQDMST